MKKWTAKDIKNTNLRNNLHESKAKNNDLKQNNIKIEKLSTEKQNIKKSLWYYNRQGIIPDYVEEFKFHPERNFRFDWAFPDQKIALEYEGLMAEKSRHTTISGYSNDCEKYNQAQILGWKVLRYTALNYHQMVDDLKTLFEK